MQRGRGGEKGGEAEHWYADLRRCYVTCHDVAMSLASHARVGGKMSEEQGEGGRGRKRGGEEEAMGRDQARESENGQGTEIG